jgi:esterase
MLYSKIEGKGEPFLILHGFLGMSDNWKTLGAQFATLGYEVHMLDMRNHGRSFQTPEFNYQLMVDDILQYCQFNNLEKITLLGHSMGGKTAMLFACDYPSLIHKLIIADIGPKYYAPHHQSIIEGLLAVDFSLKPSRTEVDTIVANYIPDFGTRQFLLKSLYWKEAGQLDFRFNIEYLSNKIEEIGRALPDEKKFLKDVLFIRGEKSKYILDSDINSIKEQFPKMKLETVTNAGHWLHAENPIDFFNYLKIFINQA